MSGSARLTCFIRQHLKTPSKKKYQVEDILWICEMTRKVLKKSPMLVQTGIPCVIVGDIRGKYRDLLAFFNTLSHETERGALKHRFMFLGGYVDQEERSIECILLLFALKCRFPNYYHLLRGTNELPEVNRKNGFYDEILNRFGDKETAEKIWNTFNETFAWMPVAGLVGEKIFCVHGGLSPYLKSFEDIEKIKRPLLKSTDSRLANDLIWAELVDVEEGFKRKENGYYFGKDAIHETCENLEISLIIRSSTMYKSGYVYFADRKLCSIFSARFPGVNNHAAIMCVDEDGHIGFNLLKPYTGKSLMQSIQNNPEGQNKSVKVASASPPESEKSLE